MAGYREHISVSGLLGLVYGVVAWAILGLNPVQAVLAGCLTWLAGMLPDLDSASGRPVREIFSLIAAAAPFVLLRKLIHWAADLETAILMAVGLYALIRYVGPVVLNKLSVHRGMFHSIPALLIAAQLVFLGYASNEVRVRLLMAAGVGLGFLSHLVLDELYSVEWSGIRIRLNQAAGTALKLLGQKFVPNVFTYALLSFLTFITLVDLGVLEDPGWTATPPLLRQAGEAADYQ